MDTIYLHDDGRGHHEITHFVMLGVGRRTNRHRHWRRHEPGSGRSRVCQQVSHGCTGPLVTSTHSIVQGPASKEWPPYNDGSSTSRVLKKYSAICDDGTDRADDLDLVSQAEQDDRSDR